MDHRRLAVYLGRIRVGLGLLLLAAPRAVLRPALGRGLESPASGVVARMAGARDAVVGAGIAIAAAERRGGASWMSMGAVTDAFDALRRKVKQIIDEVKQAVHRVIDAARAFMHAAASYDKMKGEPYNVGLSEANLSKEELCQAIQKEIPDFKYLVAPIGEDPDKRNYIVSNAKIEKTGFNAQVQALHLASGANVATINNTGAIFAGFICVMRARRFFCSSVSEGTVPVSRLHAVGEMQLERTPKRFMSSAMDFDSPTMPILAAA